MGWGFLIVVVMWGYDFFVVGDYILEIRVKINFFLIVFVISELSGI